MSITSTVRRSDMASPTVCIGNRITTKLHTHTQRGRSNRHEARLVYKRMVNCSKPVFDNGFFTWFISCVSAYSWLAASRAAADSLKQKEKKQHINKSNGGTCRSILSRSLHANTTKTCLASLPFHLCLLSHLSSSEAFWKVSVAL